jgi:hypothetical protein
MSDILLPGTADLPNLLAGKTCTSSKGYLFTGTMPNNGAIVITPSSVSQAIPLGYHNGSGNVAAVVVPVANVLTGTTIAGQAGTMPENGAFNITPSGASQAIPAGHHSGSGSVAAVSVPVANVLSGTTIAGQAGTMPEHGTLNYNPSTGYQSIPPGHTSGGTINPVTGSAGVGDVASGVTFSSANGIALTGTGANVKKRASGSATSAGVNVGCVINTLGFQPTIIIIESVNFGFRRVMMNPNFAGTSINNAPDATAYNNTISSMTGYSAPASNGFTAYFGTANVPFTWVAVE